MNLLDKLLKRRPADADKPVDLKPGYNAFGRFGSITLKVRVWRAAEGRWYDLDEVKP